MSTDPEPTPTDPIPLPVDEPPTAATTDDDQPPAEIELPPPGPDPVEETETPPAPDTPDSPVKLEPATWYEVETVCLTQDKGNGEPCRNLNATIVHPEIYSNSGDPFIYCGPCSKKRTILSARKLDPQPEMT